nr:MAG: hypothetical protein Ga0209084_100071415 [Lavidaviridae sp.]
MASFGRNVDVGEFAPIFRNFANERLELMKTAGLQEDVESEGEELEAEILPGSSRMILGGQLGEFHSQLFEPTGPLLAPERTLNGRSLHTGITKDQVKRRVSDFSSGGDKWHGPQDESRMKAIEQRIKYVDPAEGEEFWRVSGTPSHPPNSLAYYPEKGQTFEDVSAAVGYYKMEMGNWDTTKNHPNSSNGQQYNLSNLMHDRMLAKANMTDQTLNTEGPSKVFSRFQGRSNLSKRAPGLERPQTDAAVELNAFGVRRQLPWPEPGVNTYTHGGVPLAPSVQAKFPALAEEEGPPKPYDYEYQRLESMAPPPTIPLPSLRNRAAGRPWEQEYLRTRMGVSNQFGRFERGDRYRPYNAYADAMAHKRQRLLFGLPRPENVFRAVDPPPLVRLPVAPPPAPGALPAPGANAANVVVRPPVNQRPAITPSGATGPAFAPQNNLYAANPRIPQGVGHAGSGMPNHGRGYMRAHGMHGKGGPLPEHFGQLDQSNNSLGETLLTPSWAAPISGNIALYNLARGQPNGPPTEAQFTERPRMLDDPQIAKMAQEQDYLNSGYTRDSKGNLTAGKGRPYDFSKALATVSNPGSFTGKGPDVGLGAHQASNAEYEAQEQKEHNLRDLHPTYSVKYSTGERTDPARMKESGQEEQPEQASALNNLYATAETEALESGKPLVEQSSTLQGQNVAGERMSGSGLEQKLDKLLEAQEQKAARRAAKKLPKAAAEGAKKLVSFLK